MPPLIRPATPADAELIADLLVAAKEGSFPTLLDAQDRDVPFWVNRWRRYLGEGSPAQMSRGDGFAFLVERAGHAVGFAAYHHTRRHETDVELQAIYLLPVAQGQGLGTALLNTIGGLAYADGSRSMCVGYDSRNPYKRFYLKHGAMEINPHWAVWRDIRRFAPGAADAEGEGADAR